MYFNIPLIDVAFIVMTLVVVTISVISVFNKNK